jgi:hypothetical protein
MQERLPRFVRSIINDMPTAGAGVHNWLFRLARYLHGLYPEGQVFDALKHLSADAGRKVPEREIRQAVINAKAVAWVPPDSNKMDTSILDEARKPGLDAKRANLWRAIDLDYKLADLQAASPNAPRTVPPTKLLELLFPGEDTLVCLGENLQKARTNKRSFIDERLVHPGHPLSPDSEELVDALPFQFIVPSPMKSLTGLTQDGKPSRRCLQNVGPRAYAVVEFDNGTKDRQAAIIKLLWKAYPLTMVVWSGGKSLHAWFLVAGDEETNVQRFYDLAKVMGADPATRTPNQLARCPWGVRENDNVQEVLFLNLAACLNWNDEITEEVPF